MRYKASGGGLSGLAVAGTYVVTFGWDLADPALKAGLLGFAIRRTDKAAGEQVWLRGMKTFPGSAALPKGGSASSAEQPFQTFQWADYTAKPGTAYDYVIYPMHGAPGALVQGEGFTLSVTTETPEGETHNVFFNRGAIASQEYARRFQDKAPSDIGQAAYDWLSRGLFEAITAFIARADGQRFGLRCAIYEFQWPQVLKAFGAAAATGADVQIIYDAIDNAQHYPEGPNEDQIHAAGIDALCQGFKNGRIMHNKFIVLLEDGKPVSVLTGSTNYTENGIFGHLNCAHIVEDPTVARTYLDFWQELQKDPELAQMRDWVAEATPSPPDPLPQDVVEVFSPQHGSAVLDRYGQIAATANRALFMTFAFGMNAVFLPVYQRQDDVIRFALMDSVGVGNAKIQAQKDIANLQKQNNAVVAIGQNIALNSFDRWVKERDGLGPGEHVRWVHTKFMLVDPLSDDPVTITGSANFSTASVSTNHENMLVIHDKRVADIYLGEFMRQFTSYAFRDAAASHSGEPADYRPQDLIADDSWLAAYFVEGSQRALRRAYFSGS
jgi:hypothetical protein